jgi:aminoglycoside phosphotransferase (APT) family kinase protein
MIDFPDLVMRMLTERFRCRPDNLEVLTTGQSGNEVFAAMFGEAQPQSVVVKVNHDPRMLVGLERNLLALKQLGLPVPAVLDSDLSLERYPFAFVVLERIPGTDLRHELASMTRAQMSTLAMQIVDVQRRVATLELGDGFGWRSLSEVGAFSSWQAVVERDLEAGICGLETLHQTKPITRIVDLSRSLGPYFSSVQPTCFLDDLTTKNVMVQDGELRGLVDFDVVCYGDPLYWLALTRAAVIVDVGPSGQPYLNMLEQFWGVNDFGQQVLRLYTVVHIMNFACFETDSEKLERLVGIIWTQLEVST